jgi:sodium/pantothenate symporter
MWAVTITDFLQGALMFFIAFVACMIVFAEYGGPATVYVTAQTIRPSYSGAALQPLSSYAGAFIVWATCLCVLPHTIMRVFAAKNEKVGRISLGILTLLYTLTCLFTTIFIVGGSVILNDGQLPAGGNDGAFLTVINKLFSPGMAGLTFAAVFAAVMSSVSAMLLSVGAALSYDLARIFKPDISDKATKTLNVSFIVVVGILVVILAMNPPELLTLMYSAAMGLLASSLFWPTMLGLWWKRMNKHGAIACVIGGGATFLICLWGFKLAPLSQVCYSIPVGLVLAVVVSLLTPPSSEKEMKRLIIAHQREYNESQDA